MERLGPAIYFWTRALAMTSADIKKEWTDASLRGGDAARADKRHFELLMRIVGELCYHVSQKWVSNAT